MKKVITKELDLNGQKLKLETGKLALQADASVVASIGETVVLATVATKPLAQDIGYFPLSVEFVEKHYAGGRISSSRFIKRETKPTDEAVLTGRLIDRAIRPLFPKDFKNEVQVIVTVLSVDASNDPDTIGFIAASAALSISSIPWSGPLGAVRVSEREGQFVINPIREELENMDLDLIVAASKTKIAMIEAGAKQVPDELILEGIKKGHEASQPIIDLIEEFAKEAGKEKQTYSLLAEKIEDALFEEVKKLAHERIEKALFDTEHPWHEATADVIKAELGKKYEEVLTPEVVSGIFDKACKEIMHQTVLVEGKRVDGRGMEEVRELGMEAGFLPRTHGSALFQRGDTQVLSIATLGPISLSQTLEGMYAESQKRFMHHYNMAINPFSVGDVKRITGPSRRDIGHGALVERALEAVIPSKEEFPYAIRVVSEVLAANASTSQAALCGASLALLNAGVPLKEPVAGIALGLLSGEKKFQVITDMRAIEDFYGDMDFKVAGTKNGVTAIQMDTKLEGLTFEIIEEALRQGKKAREFILSEMNKVIPGPGEISQYAPKIEVTHIQPDQIGMLIGPGGKNINGIIAKTGAQIDIEEDGTVMVSSVNEESIQAAMASIQGMFKKVEVGEVYEGKVVRLAPFGAFVEILPGKDGLVHVSEMSTGYVSKPEDVVSEGQVVKVRVKGVDAEGKISLSMLFGDDIKPDSDRGGGGSDRGGGSYGGGREGGGERRGGFGDRGGSRGGFGASRSGGFGSRGGSRPSSGGFGASRGSSRGGFGGSRGGSGFGRSSGGNRGGSRGFNR